MTRLPIVLLRLAYVLCIAAGIGALGLFLAGKVDWYWVFLFTVFGFVAMALDAFAKQLEEKRRNALAAPGEAALAPPARARRGRQPG